MRLPFVPLSRTLAQATTPGDRWLMALSAAALLWLVGRPTTAGQEVQIYRDNHLLFTLPLTQPAQHTVHGRLGVVTIQVEPGRVRLLEQNSPRMIGTRTGWISTTGSMAACVPCGIVMQIPGKIADTPYDAISR